MPITPGALVHSRARRHVVLKVAEHDGCRRVGLGTLDGNGSPLTLLHPFDRIDVLPQTAEPKRAGRQGVARACAAALRKSHAAHQTRTLVDARVSLLPFQIEPALMVLRGEATRVLLADEVGLGKTIQAGLILAELRARQALRRALVLAPAGVREQWAGELHSRFGLVTTIVDAAALAGLQRSLPPWVNPWTLPGISIASIDLLKRDEVLPQLAFVVWDAVVVDEAHHATRGTDRHEVAALACSRARTVVLVTATPHSGDRPAFDDLLALGRLPSDPPVRIFRRTRSDARADAPARRTCIVRVGRHPAERRLDQLLRAYTERVWREAGGRAEVRLAMVILRKRALSGAASLARSVRRRLEALAEHGDEQPGELQLPLDFPDTLNGELLEDDREPMLQLAAPGLADRKTERQLLIDLTHAAEGAMGKDSKVARLKRAIGASREAVLVFTEYRDTMEELRAQLDEPHVAVLHGAMLPSERRQALAQFESGTARVLLATDVAAEGLNLQQRCRWIIHHEVPWSPVRIEQRNGRVDRLGQRRRVHVWHLVAAETEEDHILVRVARRSAVAARELRDQAVPGAVFGGDVLQIGDEPRTPRAPAGCGVSEAGRVDLLRRLPPGRETPRPLCAAPRFGRRTIFVFRALVLDGLGAVSAVHYVGVTGGSLTECRRAANRHLGRRSGRSIAVAAARRARMEQRDRALSTVLHESLTSPLQPSLFGRREILESEHRRAERDRALAEFRRDGRPGRHHVRISLVAILNSSRR